MMKLKEIWALNEQYCDLIKKEWPELDFHSMDYGINLYVGNKKTKKMIWLIKVPRHDLGEEFEPFIATEEQVKQACETLLNESH